jgi:predicted nucleic acid-binding protein
MDHKNMIVVSVSSPMISLAIIEKLDILEVLHRKMI